MLIVRNSRFAVSLIFAINGAVFGTWASRIPAILTIHDLSPASLGFLIFLAWAYLLSLHSLVFGRAADRYGACNCNKKNLLVAILIFHLTLIFIAYANSIWMLAAAVIFLWSNSWRRLMLQ